MKATLVTGPYGSGKTNTIRQMIPGLVRRGENVGVFVAESSALVADTVRYDLPSENVRGASFGCVCCPSEALLNRSITEAISTSKWTHLLIEPPGNLDTTIVLNALLKADIPPTNVIALAPYPHYALESVNPQFLRAIESSSIIGITKVPEMANILPQGLVDLLSRHNPDAEVLRIPKEGFSYDQVENSGRWIQRASVQPLMNLFGFENFLPSSPMGSHHQHYQKILQGIDPRLSADEVRANLEAIARSNAFVRGKGQANAQGLEFDIVHGELDIKDIKTRAGVSGYFIGFAEPRKDLPQTLLENFSPKADKLTYTVQEATPLIRNQYFLHLFEQSRTIGYKHGDQVQAHFEPIDSAYHLADEIFRKDGDSVPMQMVLPTRIALRLRALEALNKKRQANELSVGAELASYVIQHLAFDKGRDFPSWVDASQKLRIESLAVPTYFKILTKFDDSSLRYFPDYETKQGPYFAAMAKRALPFVQNRDMTLVKSARDQMVSVNVNYPAVSSAWSQLL